MSILSVFLQRKEGCAVEDCTALGFCFSCSFLRSGSLFILFAGPPPCIRRPLLKKGSIRKLFCGQTTYFSWKGIESGMPEPLIFGCRSMDSGYRPFFDAFCRAPALHPATPFEKGVDPKTFFADRQHTFHGRAKNPECRNRCFLGAGLWTPGIAPFLTLFAGPPPCTRRPLLKKGAIRKLFLRTDTILSLEGLRIRNAGTVDFWVTVYGYRSPSPLWVFCAFVHGGRHLPKALGFSATPPSCTT